MTKNYAFSICKFLLLVLTFSSCKKDAANSTSTTVSDFPTKWSVTNKGTDSNYAGNYVIQYDSLKRVSQFSEVSTNKSKVDYSDIYNFSYSGNDTIPSSYIENVWEPSGAGIIKISHFLKFDSQHRVIKDSAINNNNPNTRDNFTNRNFNYSSSKVIVITTNPKGSVIETDTTIYNGLDISRHSNCQFTSYYYSEDYTYSNNYINPFYKLKVFNLINLGYTSYHLPQTENFVSNGGKNYYSFMNYTFDNGRVSKEVIIKANGDVSTVIIEY